LALLKTEAAWSSEIIASYRITKQRHNKEEYGLKNESIIILIWNGRNDGTA